MLSQLDEKPYHVILDPSRKGCHPDTLKTLQLLKPHKIVYISCDPNTLARDLNILCKEEFYLEEVQPIDMFPQTHHIESISTLGLRMSLDNLILASSSPRRQQLLTELGIPFSVKEPSINENIESEDPYVLVKHLALEKTNKIATDNTNQLIVGADTVVFFNGKVMGKPKTNKEAIFEKISLLELKKFYGFKKLEKIFDNSVREFVKTKFAKNNQNYVMNFFLKFVSIKPSNLTIYENEDLNILMRAKKNLEIGNIQQSLDQILFIKENDMFFTEWVEQVKIYLEFKSLIEKVS